MHDQTTDDDGAALRYFRETALHERYTNKRDRRDRMNAQMAALREVAELAHRVDCDEGGAGFEAGHGLRLKATVARIGGAIEELIQHDATGGVSIEFDEGNRWYVVEMKVSPSG